MVEDNDADVHGDNVSNAMGRTDERQRASDDGYEQARLRCDVHVQQRLLPLIRKSTHMRTEWRNVESMPSGRWEVGMGPRVSDLQFVPPLYD
tara:strand:+ start:315 stop:590 length:276 start_codon:yes stop_codon:yes gene_type:complete